MIQPRDRSPQRGSAPEDTSRFVSLTEEPALGVTKVNEVGTATGPLGLASPFLIIASEPQGASYGLSFLLWRGDSEVPWAW